MLLCKGPGSLDNSFQSSSASPASRRNSLTEPGPKPAKWLLKKMKPCLNRRDFSSSASYHFCMTSPWSLCLPPKFVMDLSPTIRRYAVSEVASGGVEAYWFSDQAKLTRACSSILYTSGLNQDLLRSSIACWYFGSIWPRNCSKASLSFL